LTALLLLVRFLSELALFAALGYAGWRLPGGGLPGAALSLLLSGAAIAIWAAWIAPKAARRLGEPARLVVEVALFAASGVALSFAGRPVLAAVHFLVGIGAAGLVRRYADGS
jgi:hypothetical protein